MATKINTVKQVILLRISSPSKIPGYARFQRAFALAQKHAGSVRTQAFILRGPPWRMFDSPEK
jgi:hypothetical protein